MHLQTYHTFQGTPIKEVETLEWTRNPPSGVAGLVLDYQREEEVKFTLLGTFSVETK